MKKEKETTINNVFIDYHKENLINPNPKHRTYKLTISSDRILKSLTEKINKNHNLVKLISITTTFPGEVLIIPFRKRLSKEEVLSFLIQVHMIIKGVKNYKYENENSKIYNKRINKKIKKEAFKHYFKTSNHVNEVIKWAEKNFKYLMNPNIDWEEKVDQLLPKKDIFLRDLEKFDKGLRFKNISELKKSKKLHEQLIKDTKKRIESIDKEIKRKE